MTDTRIVTVHAKARLQGTEGLWPSRQEGDTNGAEMIKNKKPQSVADLRYYLLDEADKLISESNPLLQPMLNGARCLNYVLDEEGRPIPEPDLLKWAKSFASGARVLQRDDS